MSTGTITIANPFLYPTLESSSKPRGQQILECRCGGHRPGEPPGAGWEYEAVPGTRPATQFSCTRVTVPLVRFGRFGRFGKLCRPRCPCRQGRMFRRRKAPRKGGLAIGCPRSRWLGPLPWHMIGTRVPMPLAPVRPPRTGGDLPEGRQVDSFFGHAAASSGQLSIIYPFVLLEP